MKTGQMSCAARARRESYVGEWLREPIITDSGDDPAQQAEMARRKAYTARMFRISTMEFQKRTAGDSLMAAQRDLPDILALSGGVPIQVGNDTIGAVGSAGSSLETDDACAKAGIAKVADLLK